jgi:hypothetical protein
VLQLGADNHTGYIFYALLWFAFPAFPLAVAGVIARRGHWRSPEYILPLIVLATGVAVLLSSASARALYLLPLLPAIALLAVPMLLCIPERWLAGWTIGVRVLASVLAGVVVLLWLCLMHPFGPQPLAGLYGKWLPLGFLPNGLQMSALIAVPALIAVWTASFRLTARSAVTSAYSWLAAMALLWGMTHTLLLPWIDEARSFRPVVAELDAFAAHQPYVNECIARYNLGESVSPMWEYFGQGRGDGPIISDMNLSPCPLILTLQGDRRPELQDRHWRIIWSGSRPMRDKDQLRLYEHIPENPLATLSVPHERDRNSDIGSHQLLPSAQRHDSVPAAGGLPGAQGHV